MSTPPVPDVDILPIPGQTAVPTPTVGIVDVLDPAALAGRAAAVASRQRTENTRRAYGAAYRSLAGFVGEGAPVEALTADAVTAWVRSLERSGRSPRTVAARLAAVRKLARELGADPAIERVGSELVEPGLPRALSAGELERLLKMPDRRSRAGARDLALLQLLTDAGLRRAEAAGLRYPQIVERRRYRDPRVRAAVADTTTLAIRLRGKRGREREVPLTARAVDTLRAWADRRPTTQTDHVFLSLPTVTGREPRPLDPRDVGRIVERHTTAAAIPKDLRGVHVLRHTFATNLRAAGVELDVLRDLLGHQDIRTTQIYADINSIEHDRAIQTLENPAAILRSR